MDKYWHFYGNLHVATSILFSAIGFDGFFNFFVPTAFLGKDRNPRLG